MNQDIPRVLLAGTSSGCGKTTVGNALAERLGRKFVDADAEIEKRTGMTIPEIFAMSGETAFREIETQVLCELGKCSSLVISTGGGCVTQERNYPLLHQNSKIFWLLRDLDQLPTCGRPLSQRGRLDEMYNLRKPYYERFSDYMIDNNNTPEETISQIISKL